MKEFLKSDKGIILYLTIFFFALLPFFYLKQGLLLIDTGREFYLPQQMMNGNVLYKDLCNLYGALSYQFNAILFSIFGQKITTLYWAGIINSLIIIITSYLLSRNFANKILSSAVSILLIFALVYNTFLYNSNLTYSFAIVYALSSFLLSVLFLIKYIKEENKQKLAYISCFFAGISIANKYEFILYPIVLFLTLIIVKKVKLKELILSIFCFIAIPLLSFIGLFIQGYTFDDLKNTANFFNALVNAPHIKIFFSNFGTFFDSNKYFAVISQNKTSSILGFLPIVNVILLITFFKKIFQNKPLLILVVCSILASAKSFLFLNVEHMGVFILPICLIATISIFAQDKNFQNYALLIIFVLILQFASRDFLTLEHKNYLLETPKGNIYTYKKEGEPINYSINFLLKNNAKSALILPEGAFINYATNIKGHNKFYNLNPLFYIDVFTEEKILENIKQELPEFIIILPINNKEYGYQYFGIDYAQNFYEMIKNNYDLINEKNQTQTFKRKN